jgi:iron-sulfur cluster protein
LQRALARASSQHNQKHEQTVQEIPWEEYKRKARAVREKNIGRLPELIQRFSEEAGRAGATIHRAATAQDAINIILRIAQEKNVRLAVKSKSMVSEEISLNHALEEKGIRVVETDLGEWIIQLAKDRPSHITAPALHLTKERVAEILSLRLGRPVPADAREIVRVAREEMRQYFIQADLGISGANFAIAESGTLVIVSNEGNASLVTTLPPVHIAVVTTEKFVETLEEATTLLKALTVASSGRKITSYVSFITGPSSTTDIEKEHIVGVHGPQEVHIIILDNGRLALTEDENFKEILYCLKCGGCMLVCPVFQSVGGHIFGGPVYPGGIGTLLTAMTRSVKESYQTLDFCADCKKCQDFCPVGIPTGDLLVKLKETQGARFWEKGLSFLFRSKGLAETGSKILSRIQEIWQKDGYLKPLPFIWTKGKRIPVLKPRRTRPQSGGTGQKAYLFQGCLVSYFFPEIRESVTGSLRRFGFRVVTPPDQVCCGAPSLHLGDNRTVAKLARQNLRSFERENPDVIITVCPTGHALLKDYYPQLEDGALRWVDKIQDFTAFMVSKGFRAQEKAPARQQSLYYHHPCHYLADLKLRGRPQELLRSLGFEIASAANPPSCCGFCGVFSIKNPEISAHLWEKKKADILKSGSPLVATDCPGCIFQLRAGLKKDGEAVQAFHTAEIFAALLKNDSPDWNADRSAAAGSGEKIKPKNQ